MTKEEMIDYLRNEINRAIRDFKSASEIYGEQNDFTVKCANKFLYIQKILKDMGIDWKVEN